MKENLVGMKRYVPMNSVFYIERMQDVVLLVIFTFGGLLLILKRYHLDMFLDTNLKWTT